MLPQEKYFYNRFGLKACMDFDLWFWYGLIRNEMYQRYVIGPEI